MPQNNEEQGQLSRLLAIIEQLRDPETGCPWDQKQSFESIVPHTIEETYEVADAIFSGNVQDIKDELGDLLFQVVFYAQLGKEQGDFDFEGIAQAISDKMIRRHPHVFHKTENKIPSELNNQCSNVGFDWTELPPVVAKIYEEIEEVLVEVNASEPDQQAVEEEIGDLLFAVVNLARHTSVNAEAALIKANQKFEKRFRLVEQVIEKQGFSMESASHQQMEAAWQQIKNR
jgi:ATP diphosphatase